MAKSKPLTERQIADKLEEIRLENRWSYRQLGEQIGLALRQPAIAETTVRKFIVSAGELDFLQTTVYPLRKYVEQLSAEPARASA